MSDPRGDPNEGNNKSFIQSFFENASKKTIALCAGALGILVTIVLGAAIPNIFTLPVKVDSLEKTVDKIDDRLATIELNIRTINNSLAKNGVDTGIVRNDIVTNGAFSAKLNYFNSRSLPSANSISNSDVTKNTVVGHEKDTGAEVTVGEISNSKVLLPYRNGDQDVFFYGQINENGHWDGNCIINTYEGDKLVLITDAVYDDGTPINCKQIFYYTLRNGQEVWAYSDYLWEDGSSSGDTWLYTKESDYPMAFSADDVSADGILSADDFRDSVCHELAAYYSGNTSDGFFNDETGNAYMVYFFEDGTVRLLYSGNFKDGTFNDNTGKAWYIVKNENTAYMYAKGLFKHGELVNSGIIEEGPPPLSLEDIEKYTSQREFDFPFEIKWAGFN